MREPSIAKTPNIRCFVVILHLSRFTRFFWGNIPFLEIQIYLYIYRTEKLWIEQKSYQKNRKAIDRTEKLSKEQKSYR